MQILRSRSKPLSPQSGRYSPRRSGATTFESAVVLGCWTLVFAGIFDAGIATMRHNTVAHIARQATRMAIVRGSQSGPELSPWGPTTRTVNLADTSDISQAMAQYVQGLHPSAFTLKLEWPDGNNDPDSRVMATVRPSYHPIVAKAFGRSAIPMQARSTMPIAH